MERAKYIPFSKCSDIIGNGEANDRTTPVTESRVVLPHPADDGRQGADVQDQDGARPGPTAETQKPQYSGIRVWQRGQLWRSLTAARYYWRSHRSDIQHDIICTTINNTIHTVKHDKAHRT